MFSTSLISSLLWVLFSCITGMAAYFMRNLIMRLETLENKIQSKIDEPEVRQLLSDKLDPMKEDIAEIKGTVQKLFDLHIASYNRGE